MNIYQPHINIKPSLISKLSLILFLIIAFTFTQGCSQQSKIEAPTTPTVDLSDLPVMTFSIGEQTASIDNNRISISEGVGGIGIIATLSKPSSVDLEFLFAYNSNGSTANNLNDFLIPIPDAPDGQQTGTQNTILFKAGETTKSFLINIVNDDFFEKNEIISLWLLNDKNATMNLPNDILGRPYLEIEIIEDDAEPDVAFGSVKIAGEIRPLADIIETSENQTVEISIILPFSKSSKSMRVKFQITTSPEAIETVDYDFPFPENRLSPTSNISEFVFLSEEENITFFLPIYSDLINENPEDITITLLPSDDGNYTLFGPTSITITINDDGNNGRPLNDTGITKCYDTDPTSPITCGNSSFPTGDQDGATANGPRFLKFAYVRRAADGISTPLPDNSNDVNCVLDQNTNLLWEVPEINSKEQYTWFNQNPTTNGGSSGAQRETDGSVIATGSGSTQNREEELNNLNANFETAQGYCEIQKWRLPTLTELLSIMDFETPDTNTSFLDVTYFSNNRINEGLHYWTSSPSPINPDDAWCVSFAKVIKDSVKLCDKQDLLPAIMVSTEVIDVL